MVTRQTTHQMGITGWFYAAFVIVVYPLHKMQPRTDFLLFVCLPNGSMMKLLRHAAISVKNVALNLTAIDTQINLAQNVSGAVYRCGQSLNAQSLRTVHFYALSAWMCLLVML